MRAFIEAVNLLNETATMYHGTLATNVPSILGNGLQPSQKSNAEDRWATLGGVYLTSDPKYAVKAAKEKSDGEPIAVIVVRVNPDIATPDEDVVEKALIHAYTTVLDWFGVDEAYEGDLDEYADHEEQRPRDFHDDEPFDREAFFREFWESVERKMEETAGSPLRRDPDLIQDAIGYALALVQHHYVDLAAWQRIKEELVANYPGLRDRDQHAKSGVSLPHNVRVTEPIGLSGENHIAAVFVEDEKGWSLLYGSPPSDTEIGR